MKKTIIICGLIGGLIVTSWMFAAMVGILSPYFEGGMLLGYTTMLVAFSVIFVAIKNVRDKYNGGTISYGKAFRIGLWITLLSSTIYVLVWMIDYHFFIPDFYDKYAANILAKMKASGASPAAIQKQTDQAWMFKNQFFITFMTYMEILPVGLIVSLIAAAVLKRKPAADGQMAANMA